MQNDAGFPKAQVPKAYIEPRLFSILYIMFRRSQSSFKKWTSLNQPTNLGSAHPGVTQRNNFLKPTLKLAILTGILHRNIFKAIKSQNEMR